MRNNYSVVVGMLGTVHTGKSLADAKKHYMDCVELSLANTGRACGEPVALFANDEILEEHFGANQNEYD